MLKDLFFFIWFDEMGCGWIIFAVALFLLFLALIICIVARTKAQTKKLTKASWTCILFALFLMYQIVPVSFDMLATLLGYNRIDYKKVINFEKLAIKTSIIPWQKGGYYIKLANWYMLDKDYKNQLASLDKAYEYIKDYKYPCWGINFLVYYSLGKYDKAIELAKNYKVPNSNDSTVGYAVVARCYIMKGDLGQAIIYADKRLKYEKNNSKYNKLTLALKGYLEKRKGNYEAAERFYKQALDIAKSPQEKKLVEETYEDLYAYEQERLKKNLEKLSGR